MRNTYKYTTAKKNKHIINNNNGINLDKYTHSILGTNCLTSRIQKKLQS